MEKFSWEIALIALIIMFIMFYTGQISFNKLMLDNEALFRKLKEDDWDFLVKSRYGNKVNPDILFNKRIRNWVIITFLMLLVFISDLNTLKVVGAIFLGCGTYKIPYMDLKNYYKKHIHQIDAMLPHYLKSIEILIQHYTVPVALGKSIHDAPEIFRDGLQDLINAINSGNDTIEPYMDFAKVYPVRDSMRMMRLLYRLSIGRQERKQEQLIAFSKSISNLQQKARETKYKARLDKMEGMTMKMLVSTGVGVMIILLLGVMQMISM